MEDPLADPRARDLLSAAPGDVLALAGLFRSAASEAYAVSVGLEEARRDGNWTGRAAEAFRRSIARLPVRLDAVRAGFEEVATSLTAYEPELVRLQVAFRRTAEELAEARAWVGPEREAPVQAAAVQALVLRAFVLLSEFEQARGACRLAIASAEATAPAHRAAGRGTTAIGGSSGVLTVIG